MKQPALAKWLIVIFLTLAVTSCQAPPPLPPAPGPASPSGPVAERAESPPPTPSPPAAVELIPAEVSQGDFFTIKLSVQPGARLDPDWTYRARLEGWSPQAKFFAAPGGAVALAAVDPGAKPGRHHLRAVVGETGLPILLEVKAKRFTESRLTMPRETADLRIDPRLPAERQEVLHSRSSSSPKALWEGDFMVPAQGEITTYFGEKRFVNGEPDGWHNGTDIANREGTPIVASNSGRVVLSRRLVMTGYTVIIDHGLNLFTSYSHLSAIKISPGQEVKKGQVIGLMGSTGYSTGSHLHWVATIGNASFNPQSLISSGALPSIE